MAPNEIGNYVAVHEVAHLVHLNHGQDFWELVQKLNPEYKEHREWIRSNGKSLHKFVFD